MERKRGRKGGRKKKGRKKKKEKMNERKRKILMFQLPHFFLIIILQNPEC